MDTIPTNSPSRNSADLDYRQRAEAHKPSDAAGIRAAALEMLRSGLTDHDVGHVLRLDANAVRRLVGECTECGG